MKLEKYELDFERVEFLGFVVPYTSVMYERLRLRMRMRERDLVGGLRSFEEESCYVAIDNEKRAT